MKKRKINKNKLFYKGSKFGRLLVLEDLPNKGKQPRLKAICDCGNIRDYFSQALKNGNTTSCGCYRDSLLITHGEYKTPEYRAMINAQQRCTNSKRRGYENYGGKGVRFLFKSYEEFINHVGKRTSPKHSLDRYPDTDGNYEIGNVRWATRLEQNLNRRKPKNDNIPRGVSVRNLKNGGHTYTARITLDYKVKTLGVFPTMIQAEKAYLFAYFRAYKEMPPEYRG